MVTQTKQDLFSKVLHIALQTKLDSITNDTDIE